jgi:hypothetical protein
MTIRTEDFVAQYTMFQLPIYSNLFHSIYFPFFQSYLQKELTMKSNPKLIADVTLRHLAKIRPVDPLVAFRVFSRDDDHDVDAHALFVTRENAFCVMLSPQQAGQIIDD